MVSDLRSRGFPASNECVERLMRESKIHALHKRRYKVTTDSKHNLPIAKNLRDRNFNPAAPNQVWTSDITYLWTDEGWLDMFNREVVGPRMAADIVTDALRMTWFRKKPAAGLVHHSDRGSQYASHAFQEKLKTYGMVGSMSRKENCWDNAPLKAKMSGCTGVRFETRAEMTAMSVECIEVLYN